MTRKHFRALATVLAAQRPTYPDNGSIEQLHCYDGKIGIWRSLVRGIANVCAMHAAGEFKRDRFYSACGYEE